MTGLQEIKNFMAHLNKPRGCKNNPKRVVIQASRTGKPIVTQIEITDMQEALEIRAKSGQ